MAPDRALICETRPALTQAGLDSEASSGMQTKDESKPPAAHATWVSLPCHGARGCSKRGDEFECDDTVSSEGEPCPSDPPLDYACTKDHARALVCKAGRYELWRTCRGPQGCAIEGARTIRCDTTLGEEGDPCGQAATYSCSVDQHTMLACDGAKLVAASSCRGPAGCRVERDARKVDCDDAVAQLGDPCDHEGRITCAADHKAELSCSSGRYDKKRDCRHSDCRLDGNELFCD